MSAVAVWLDVAVLATTQLRLDLGTLFACSKQATSDQSEKIAFYLEIVYTVCVHAC